MLLLSTKLQSAPVMSLQTGTKIAELGDPIINPATFNIPAYHVNGSGLQQKNVLLTEDMREVSSIGCIVDSIDEIISQDDMVKLKPLLKLNFQLIDKQVIDQQRNKLGKVNDFTIDPSQFKIYQLHIKRPLIKSLQTKSLIINRKQIIEVNNKHIVVKSATESIEEQVSEVNEVTAFVNPFRKSATGPTVNNLEK